MNTGRKNKNQGVIKMDKKIQKKPMPKMRGENETFFPESLARAKEILKEIVWLPR